MDGAHTSFALEVGQRRDENLMEEERTAVHLDRPGEKATEVVDISGEEGEKEKKKGDSAVELLKDVR